MVDIVRDDAIRSGTPRIDGTRISVLDVKRRVIDESEDPHVVAGEYGVGLADLFGALAYYYEHREELRRREHEDAEHRQSGERRTAELLERESRERAEEAD